jgi:hypothetical protein
MIHESFAQNTLRRPKLKLAHFYHVFAVKSWERIVTEHLEALKTSGLMERIGQLHLGIVGPLAQQRAVEKLCNSYLPVEVVATAVAGGEQVTLNALWELRKLHDAVLYAHTKGVSEPPRHTLQLQDQWRRSMTAALVGDWQRCEQLLEDYDMVGCYWWGVYFAGNFWWARSEYLQRCKPPPSWTKLMDSAHGRIVLADQGLAGHEPRIAAEEWFFDNQPLKVFDLLPETPSCHGIVGIEKMVYSPKGGHEWKVGSIPVPSGAVRKVSTTQHKTTGAWGNRATWDRRAG